MLSPCPYALLPAPRNHLFSYFHQQPNYWSFKVSVWCFCFRGNCMCFPALPLPAHALHRGVHLHGIFWYGWRALGLQDVAAALRESGFTCQGLLDPTWAFGPLLLGI